MKNLILLKNWYIDMWWRSVKNPITNQMLLTLVANFAYYWYVLSKDAYHKLSNLKEDVVKKWWSDIEPILKEVTWDNRKMDNYVVYKNFPQEVLEMSEAEYWSNQIHMYYWFNNDLFTQDESSRSSLFETMKLSVLNISDKNSLNNICSSILSLPSRWTEEQYDFVSYLIIEENISTDLSVIPFKENMVKIMTKLINADCRINIKSATDVIRLAIWMSDWDVSMRENSKFRNFSRKERRYFLWLLNESTSLKEDVMRDKNKWKKFIRNLHPWDYKSYYNVISVYNALYNNNLKATYWEIERMLSECDVNVLDLMQKRPWDYSRRLVHLIELFWEIASKKFIEIINNLSVLQILKISKILEKINNREFRVFPPRWNWSKLQVVKNDKNIDKNLVSNLLTSLNKELWTRVGNKAGKVRLSDKTKFIKIQNNDSELTNYWRGTKFPIPSNIKFIRTASYWKHKGYWDTWFDNWWNFFDKDWESLWACCWNNEKFWLNKQRTNFLWISSDNLNINAAVFSWDPTNSKDLGWRACQMIDLYLDELRELWVRYAVWNILCYSHVSFNQAEDVFAALQWWEEPQKWKLFEPSRCQLSFPIKWDNFTKYIAYIDLKENNIVYIDANLPARVSSAAANQNILNKNMPAFVEYLDTLPSVYDLFKNSEYSDDWIPLLYEDTDEAITTKSAYVFKPSNEQNSYKQFDITNLLN